MLLKKENETVVYTGGTYEEIGWGAIQFPKFYEMKNGNIGMSVHDKEDTWAAFLSSGLKLLR